MYNLHSDHWHSIFHTITFKKITFPTLALCISFYYSIKVNMKKKRPTLVPRMDIRTAANLSINKALPLLHTASYETLSACSAVESVWHLVPPSLCADEQEQFPIQNPQNPTAPHRHPQSRSRGHSAPQDVGYGGFSSALEGNVCAAC